MGVYPSQGFCQRSHLLRMFAFYFNSLSLLGMEESSPTAQHLEVLQYCLQQLRVRSEETEPMTQELKGVHPNMIGERSSPCPVCSNGKKTTYQCQVCIRQFGVYFGLCEPDCFHAFHKNPLYYG